MQATGLSPSGLTPSGFKPKMGRPPALKTPITPKRRLPRLPFLTVGTLLSLGLVVAVTLGVMPWFTRGDAPAVPPLLPENFSVKTSEGSLSGSVSAIDSSPGTIDNTDRERLLSILSKD